MQKITEFASADIPVAVGLVFDDSGSMRSKRPDVITAGLVFIGASNPQDQIFVVNFNDKVRRGLPETVPFTDDIKLLRSALSRDMAEGQTALYDAIALSLDHLQSGRRDKKTLVVVSDGGDNVSKHMLKELMQLVQESRATIYTIGIFAPDDPDRNPQVLERIARVKVLLLQRFPNATADELTAAHAYAYCGSIIQDLGYYPFSSKFFSDLTHYVRSGDFVASLIRNSQDLNEYAFSLGALAHYAADNNGHRIATNLAVPLLYPKLRLKFGNLVTYADDPFSHLKTEFGFDVF